MNLKPATLQTGRRLCIVKIVITTKQCKYMQQETRQCQNCKQEFVIEPEDFDFYEKIRVPAPTFCPECRAIRRAIFFNQVNLFKKTPVKENKKIFSQISFFLLLFFVYFYFISCKFLYLKKSINAFYFGVFFDGIF